MRSGQAALYIRSIFTQALVAEENRDWPKVDYRLVRMANDRMLGVGRDQYTTLDADGNEVQKFESMTPCELIEYLREELADALNYLGMIAIRTESAAFKLAEGLSVDLSRLIFEAHRKLSEYGPCSTEEHERG